MAAMLPALRARRAEFLCIQEDSILLLLLHASSDDGDANASYIDGAAGTAAAAVDEPMSMLKMSSGRGNELFMVFMIYYFGSSARSIKRMLELMKFGFTVVRKKI